MVINKKINAATLLESLAALAIISTVFGCAFTLYNQTISNSNQIIQTQIYLLENDNNNENDQLTENNIILSNETQYFNNENNLMVRIKSYKKASKIIINKKQIITSFDAKN